MQTELLHTSPPREELGPGSVVLRGYVLPRESVLLESLEAVVAAAPFRHMMTPGGFRMSVAMTNCGALGWVTDRRGYRYEPVDLVSGQPWPAMPPVFSAIAEEAARECGYPAFRPDACLINRYEPKAKMSLHQDKDETDFQQPIVSVSLGLTATFQFGGMLRTDPVAKIQLLHGDVVVWGGPDRLRFHGILPLKAGQHPPLGAARVNLTFRKAA